jgi:hypothetical protein
VRLVEAEVAQNRDLLARVEPRLAVVAGDSANFAYRFRKESFSVPVGPLRCLARWTSARPCDSDSSL